MKRLALIVSWWLALSSPTLAAFTELFCNASTGNNTYAGSTEGAPVATLTGGSYVSATGVFTKAGADFSAVTVGMFVGGMRDAGTVAAIVGRVSAVDDALDTLTIHATARSGSLTDGTADTTMTVGGVWNGPNAAVGFPVGFVTATLTNSSGDTPRVNFKNNATYSITTGITADDTGLIRWEGYTTTAGDGGRATLDGSTNAITLWTVTAVNNDIANFILVSSATTGAGEGLRITGNECRATGTVVHGTRFNGFFTNGATVSFEECEAYECNTGNSALAGGFYGSGNYTRCIAHDNAGTNSRGFSIQNDSTLTDCLADTNGADGFLLASSIAAKLLNCDAYNNTGDGVDVANVGTAYVVIENSNLIKNGGWGINGSGAGALHGDVRNCGFGAGSQANTSGTTTGLKSVITSGTVTYAAEVTPWVGPTTGDFRINLAAAKNTGRGAFVQTAASYTGTVGYPDIGAAQHQEAASGGGSVFGGGVVR